MKVYCLDSSAFEHVSVRNVVVNVFSGVQVCGHIGGHGNTCAVVGHGAAL